MPKSLAHAVCRPLRALTIAAILGGWAVLAAATSLAATSQEAPPSHGAALSSPVPAPRSAQASQPAQPAESSRSLRPALPAQSSPSSAATDASQSPRLSQPAPSAQPAQPASPPLLAPALTAADLDAFFAGLMPVELRRNDIAGAVVAVVKDGSVLFAKGYGRADAAGLQPVSPDGTLFRLGSVSKLFTWVAVMQLVEQGRLGLDADVTGYLDFRIPPTFSHPITLRHLMTHTAGFEETVKDLGAPDNPTPGTPAIESLRTYVVGHLPKRIYPPGSLVAYSNYGATLAGYIVQRVSGEPFEAYVARHILQPLGMRHTTFVQPLPAPLQPLMSAGFLRGSAAPRPFENVNATPAGAVTASALDMTHFMLALLQEGQYGDAHILRPDTARQMEARQFAMHPKAKAMCLGLYEESHRGVRVIGHGGDTILFHSDLHLLPEAGVGLFVAYNSLGRADIAPRTPLLTGFLDRYFPAPPAPRTTASANAALGASTTSTPAATPAGTRSSIVDVTSAGTVDTPSTRPATPAGTVTAASTAPAPAPADPRDLAGSYVGSRRFKTTIFSLADLLGQSVVSAERDGTLTVDDFRNLERQPKRWRQVAPGLFDEIGGPGEIVFLRDAAGRLDLLPAGPPIYVLSRTGLYEDKRLVTAAACLFLLVAAATLLLWPIAAVVRRHYGRRLDLAPPARRRRLAVRVVCALQLLFFVLFVGTLAYSSQHLTILNDSLDPWWRTLQALGWLGVLGIAIVVADTAATWFARGRAWAKLHTVALTLASAAFLYLVVLGHMLAFSLHY